MTDIGGIRPGRAIHARLNSAVTTCVTRWVHRLDVDPSALAAAAALHPEAPRTSIPLGADRTSG
ncbi:hypothetical protein [Gordonia sp. NPDC003376]